MAQYSKLSDGTNIVVFSHNVADMSQVDKVLYSGTDDAAANLALVQVLMGAGNQIRVADSMSASLVGVDTVSEVETYVDTNATEIENEATLLERS